MKEPDQLRKAISDKGIAKIQTAYAFAEDKEIPWIQNLLRGMGEISEWTEEKVITVNNPVATIQVTSAYFRAIAKCVFHYFLTVVPEVLGSEPQFEPLRDFIIKGGDIDRFFQQETRPVIAYPHPHLRPSSYGHVVVAEWEEGRIWGRCQFFIGPDYEPRVNRIKIADHANQLDVERLKVRGHKGHFFAYFPGGHRGRFDGEVSELINANNDVLPESEE